MRVNFTRDFTRYIINNQGSYFGLYPSVTLLNYFILDMGLWLEFGEPMIVKSGIFLFFEIVSIGALLVYLMVLWLPFIYENFWFFVDLLQSAIKIFLKLTSIYTYLGVIRLLW